MAEEASPRRIATELIDLVVAETMPSHQIIPDSLEPSAMVTFTEVNLYPPFQTVATGRTEDHDGVEPWVVYQSPLQLLDGIRLLGASIVALGLEVVEHGVHLTNRTKVVQVYAKQLGMRYQTLIVAIATHA